MGLVVAAVVLLLPGLLVLVRGRPLVWADPLGRPKQYWRRRSCFYLLIETVFLTLAVSLALVRG